MALTIQTEILGQEATSTCTYCYLYEPLRVVISESDTTAKQIFIKIEAVSTATGVTTIISPNYGVFDLNPGATLSVDLMKLARQFHNPNVYNFSSLADIADPTNGWKASVSEYKYLFKITSDVTTTPKEIFKLPIIGGRDFRTFTPALPAYPTATEGIANGIDILNVWKGWSFLTTTFALASATDARPTISIATSTSGIYDGCAGQVVWKSKLGGWMTWGFKLKKEKLSKRYLGNIQVGMFESTLDVGGNAYIPVDYTGISTSYTIDLKQLSLNSNELEAVHDIIASPAVYYMREKTGELELMQLGSASAPLDNKTSGGDFSVSLKSISTTSQQTR